MAGRPKLPKQAKDIGPVFPLLYRFDLRPKAQERARTNKYGYNYTPQPTRDYESEINAQAMAQHPLPEPFTADLAVVINLRFRDGRNGDIDNIAKSLLDGMSPRYQNAEMIRPGVWRTDKIIKKMHVEIFYDREAVPCSEVIVYRHHARPWANRLRSQVIWLWIKIADWLAIKSSGEHARDLNSGADGEIEDI